MTMYNPAHPGEFIQATYLEPFALSQNEMADKLCVARSTFNRIIRGSSGISPEMALRLSKVIGRTPESWLEMQARYDLYKAKKKLKGLGKLKRVKFPEITENS